MIGLGLADGPLEVLCLGAHPDDIEIGCGGTLLRLAAEGRIAEARWVVLSGTPERAAEARRGAECFLPGVDRREVVLREFRDGFFPHAGPALKEAVEDLKGFEPDLVFAPRREDLHQDHRAVAELAWQTFRDHAILEYEIAKYEGDLGTPNLYVTLPEETCRRKIDLILETFRSQAARTWMTPDTFWALLRLRGLESGAGSRFAEGFTARKIVL